MSAATRAAGHGEPAPIHWGAETLWQQLAPLLPGLSVEIVRSIASTNSALLSRARVVAEVDADGSTGPALVRRSLESAAFGRRAADVQPCLLVAEHQTGGRGRQGRAWHSAAGASLTFSLGLPLRAGDWSGLSLAVGAALCEALAPAGDTAPRLGLKWPNDLWLMDAPGVGRKLGGILIETVSAGSDRLVVIGIGINIQPMAIAGLQTGLACLQEIDPGASAPDTLARIALPLAQALKQFETGGFAAFAERFARLDLLYGLTIRTTHPDVPEGLAQGVSANGALQVLTPSGLRSVSSGEVSVRPVVTASPGTEPEGPGPDAPC